MTVPGIFNLTGSPITTSGTLALSLNNQNANQVFAGPSSGSATTPTFRSLVASDIPTLNQNTTGNAATATTVTGTVAVANGGTGNTILNAYAPLFGGTTNTGTTAWINDNGSASFASGGLTIDVYGDIVIQGDVNIDYGSGITMNGGGDISGPQEIIGNNGAVMNDGGGLWNFPNGIEINTGDIDLNPDGSAQFANGTINISSGGNLAIEGGELLVTNTSYPAHMRLSQKNNGEVTWSYNVDPNNSDAIDNTADMGWKFAMAGTGSTSSMDIQSSPAGSLSWTGTTIWSIAQDGSLTMDSGAFYSDGAGNVTVNTLQAADIYYNYGNYLADSNQNLYYGGGGGILATPEGVINFSGNSSYGTVPLIDAYGNIYYNAGGYLADYAGRLYYGNGYVMTDPTVSPSLLYYPGLGEAHPLANSDGILYWGGDGGGHPLADNYDILYLRGGLQDMSGSNGTSGQVLTSDGTNATWQNATGFNPPYNFEAPTTLFTAGSQPVIGIDDNGNPFLESLTGNVVLGFDSNGSLMYDNNILFDISTTPVQLNYPGLGSSYPLADSNGKLYASAIYSAFDTNIWANPSTRIIYDQYNEQAISTMSDTWNTDSTTTLISDPDYGCVVVNVELFVRDSLQIQPFGGANSIQLNQDGSASFSSGAITFDGTGNASFGSGVTGIFYDGSADFCNGGVRIDSSGNLYIGAQLYDAYTNTPLDGQFLGCGQYDGGRPTWRYPNYANQSPMTDSNSLFYPPSFDTASAPAYVEGALYFDTTLNKLVVGGASNWETVNSGDNNYSIQSANFTASTGGINGGNSTPVPQSTTVNGHPLSSNVTVSVSDLNSTTGTLSTAKGGTGTGTLGTGVASALPNATNTPAVVYRFPAQPAMCRTRIRRSDYCTFFVVQGTGSGVAYADPITVTSSSVTGGTCINITPSGITAFDPWLHQDRLDLQPVFEERLQRHLPLLHGEFARHELDRQWRDHAVGRSENATVFIGPDGKYWAEMNNQGGTFAWAQSEATSLTGTWSALTYVQQPSPAAQGTTGTYWDGGTIIPITDSNTIAQLQYDWVVTNPPKSQHHIQQQWFPGVSSAELTTYGRSAFVADDSGYSPGQPKLWSMGRPLPPTSSISVTTRPTILALSKQASQDSFHPLPATVWCSATTVIGGHAALSGANLSEYGQEIISFDENGAGGSASGFVIQGSTHSYYHLDVGYDTTNARGFIQAGQSGAWSPLCLQPNGVWHRDHRWNDPVNSLVCSIDGGLGLTAGNTVNLKGGSNAASGTVTLSSGAATVTTTALLRAIGWARPSRLLGHARHVCP
ncbi:unnamed protein product [Sphagnum jensenii]|uniref:Uncharacterized protein n=1 Tax=Sphagnum jensenii TaxID=128206 RepID=A0ABP0VFU5_9BRYO